MSWSQPSSDVGSKPSAAAGVAVLPPRVFTGSFPTANYCGCFPNSGMTPAQATEVYYHWGTTHLSGSLTLQTARDAKIANVWAQKHGDRDSWNELSSPPPYPEILNTYSRKSIQSDTTLPYGCTTLPDGWLLKNNTFGETLRRDIGGVTFSDTIIPVDGVLDLGANCPISAAGPRRIFSGQTIFSGSYNLGVSGFDTRLTCTQALFTDPSWFGNADGTLWPGLQCQFQLSAPHVYHRLVYENAYFDIVGWVPTVGGSPWYWAPIYQFSHWGDGTEYYTFQRTPDFGITRRGLTNNESYISMPLMWHGENGFASTCSWRHDSLDMYYQSSDTAGSYYTSHVFRQIKSLNLQLDLYPST